MHQVFYANKTTVVSPDRFNMITVAYSNTSPPSLFASLVCALKHEIKTYMSPQNLAVVSNVLTSDTPFHGVNQNFYTGFEISVPRSLIDDQLASTRRRYSCPVLLILLPWAHLP